MLYSKSIILKNIKDPSISKEKYDYRLNISNRVSCEKWVGFIEDHKKYFIWQEEIDEGKETLANLDKMPVSFREGILKGHNKSRTMKYYTISYMNSPKITGSTFPQVQKIDPPQDYYAGDSMYVFSYSRSKFPEGDINPKYLLLEKEAILTDALSSSMLGVNGFLISTKLKELFESIVLPEHRFYSVSIMDYNKAIHKYYWAHLLDVFYGDSKFDYVDFSKTEFAIYKRTQKISEIDVANLEQLLDTKDGLEKGQKIMASKIALEKDFLELKLDLFKLPLTGNIWYLSEAAKESLDSQGITGFKYAEANNLYIV